MSNQQSQATLRKAAILIASLDDRAADALLDQMGPEQAAKVRNAIMELDEIPQDEQQRVIAEFLGRGPSSDAAVTASFSEGVELSGSLAEQIEAPSRSYATAAGIARESTVPYGPAKQPFAFLKNVDSNILARLLGREHPQTIAVVIAHLPPEQVAEILAALPSETSIEALGRMARLDELSPDVLSDIERELEARLPHMATARLQPQGVASIQAVLDVLDQAERDRLLEKLGRKDARLLRRLGYVPAGENPFDGVKPTEAEEPQPPTVSMNRFSWTGSPPELHHTDEVRSTMQQIADEHDVDLSHSPDSAIEAPRAPAGREGVPPLTFDEFVLLDDDSLAEIVDHAEVTTLELALTGAEPRLIRRVLRLLPVREAARWRQRLERPSPLRLRDIESAREVLARLAMRLVARELVKLPKRRGFATSA